MRQRGIEIGLGIIIILFLITIPVFGESSFIANVTVANTTTPTPTPTQTSNGGGGGGGGGSSIGKWLAELLDLNKNPPTMTILADGQDITILIKNEGDEAQEYIINWKIQDTKGAIIDNGVESKRIEPSESYNMHLTFPTLHPGTYTIKAVVQYGIYTSEATKIILVGEQAWLWRWEIGAGGLAAGIILISIFIRKSQPPRPTMKPRTRSTRR